MAVRTVLPVTKPGETIEGLPSADEIALLDGQQPGLVSQQDVSAGQKAVDAAVSEAAAKQGPTVELASATQGSVSTLAYASPVLPSASDALAAQMAATGGASQTFDPTAAASITVASSSSTPRSEIDELISKYAALYGVPESLVHRVAKRESTYDPRAHHRGNYGLMQIRYNTARGLGYDGAPNGLFDAETNLKYAVKYLRGAWLVADKNEKAADWLYRTGYYYEAKRRGMLDDLQ